MRVATLDQMRNDPSFPYWGIDLLDKVRDKDPVDVLNVLEAISAAIREQLGYLQS